MKEIMQQMLQDVVTHFSENPEELRSVNNKGGGLYNPPKEKPKSIGCAIGMYINIKNAKKLDVGTVTSINCIIGDEKEKLLPKWMLKIDKEFLGNLQRLHDGGEYWTKEDISDSGKKEVKRICKEFSLNYPKFKK